MSELLLDIRQKEIIVEFRHWLRQNGLKVFTSDTFRQFLIEKQWVNRLIDSKNNLNIGSLFRLMLCARNPMHRIEKVGWTSSEVGSNQGRAIREYKFVNP